MSTKTISNSDNLAAQFEAMLESGRLPLFEYELNNDEFLIVALEVCYDNSGINFSFDTDGGEPTFPESIIEHVGGNYLMPFEEATTDLDSYLNDISECMGEGFLLPNGLL